MDFNNNDRKIIVALLAIMESDKNKWDRMANLELSFSSLVNQEYQKYFDDLFSAGVPHYTLSSTTSLYRARQITGIDKPKIGSCFQEN